MLFHWWMSQLSVFIGLFLELFSFLREKSPHLLFRAHVLGVDTTVGCQDSESWVGQGGGGMSTHLCICSPGFPGSEGPSSAPAWVPEAGACLGLASQWVAGMGRESDLVVQTTNGVQGKRFNCFLDWLSTPAALAETPPSYSLLRCCCCLSGGHLPCHSCV